MNAPKGSLTPAKGKEERLRSCLHAWYFALTLESSAKDQIFQVGNIHKGVRQAEFNGVTLEIRFRNFQQTDLEGSLRSGVSSPSGRGPPSDLSSRSPPPERDRASSSLARNTLEMQISLRRMGMRLKRFRVYGGDGGGSNSPSRRLPDQDMLQA